MNPVNPSGGSLGSVSSASDSAFCKHVGQPSDSYQTFLRTWRAGRQRNRVSIPWLPEGMDLPKLVLGADRAREA